MRGCGKVFVVGCGKVVVMRGCGKIFIVRGCGKVSAVRGCGRVFVVRGVAKYCGEGGCCSEGMARWLWWGCGKVFVAGCGKVLW